MSAVLPFADEATKTQTTIDGVAVELLRAPKKLENGPFADLANWADTGTAYEGDTARVSAADAAALVADPARLQKFADKMIQNPTGASPDDTIQAIGRGDVIPRILDDVYAPGDSWPDKAKFSASLRRAVQSLLSVPSVAVFHAMYVPDWEDFAIIVVTQSNEIRVLHVYGDI